MHVPPYSKGYLLPALAALAFFSTTMLAVGSTDWSQTDPAHWTADDVYSVLNNSPWSKVVKVTLPSGVSLLGDQSARGAGNGTNNPNGTWRNDSGVPGSYGGGMGRRSMGGARSNSGTYNSGGSIGDTDRSAKPRPAEITIQWQSALPVRFAAAKKAGHDLNDIKTDRTEDEYVIAVIGLPSTAVGGRAASVDSDSTIDADDARRIEDTVKNSASLLRSGHETLTPERVEPDQGADGRLLIYFPAKKNPIVASEKSVEFRLRIGRTEIRKKFLLKDMEFDGRLQL